MPILNFSNEIPIQCHTGKSIIACLAGHALRLRLLLIIVNFQILEVKLEFHELHVM